MKRIIETLLTIKSTGSALKRLTLGLAASAAVVVGSGLTANAAPANDNFADAINLPGRTGIQTGTDTVGATLEVGEPDPLTGAANTVWFKWTCPTDGTLTVSTLGSRNPSNTEWDAILGIYAGASVDALTPLGTTPQDGGVPESMTVTVTNGTTYYIQLAGYVNAEAANIKLTWNLAVEANMITFGLPGNLAIISGTNIAWEVLIGTDLTTLAPIYTTSFGATCPKASGSTNDFTSPVHYILTSSDSLVTNDYLVTVTAVPEKLAWTPPGGGSDTWDTNLFNWTGVYTLVNTNFSDGIAVVFSEVPLTSPSVVTITPEMAPLSTTVSAPSGTYTFIGGPISGSGSLTKSGGGTLIIGGGTLATTNTYTGKTIVQGGTLISGLGTNYLSNAGVPGVFGAPTGANATIDLYNGVTLQNNGSKLRQNQATDRPLNLAGTGPGTVSIRVNDNDTSFTFGDVTATGTGPKTLALFTGSPAGNGDRESLIFTGGISDSSDGSPTSLAVTFRTQTASTSFVSLPGTNTFTGPITLTPFNANPTCYLSIGGKLVTAGGMNFTSTPGSGKLGNGNYPGAISLGAQTILYYNSSSAQVLSGPISGVGTLTKPGSGTLTLSGTNTYRGNTTVSSGTLVLADTGVYTFYLTDKANNKITGTGTATLNGTFTLDTSAVMAPFGSWTLVDTTTKSFGATFGLTGFLGPVGGVFTKVDGLQTWTFDTATAKLSLTGPALIMSFGIPGSASYINYSTHTIQLYLPGGTAFATLAPTFTLSSGTCDQTSGSPPSPTFAAASPVHYIVTDGPVTNDYKVTAIIAPLPLNGLKVWLNADAIDPADLSQVDATNNVVKWNDASGNLNNAVMGTISTQPPPKYAAGILNGKPVLQFTQGPNVNDDGSRLYLGDLSAQFPSAASIYAVGTLNTDKRYTLFGNRGNDERWVADTWSECVPGSFKVSRANFSAAGYPLMPGDGSHVFALESSSAAYTFRVDATLIGTTAGQYHNGSGVNWNIGNRFSTTGNDAQLNGDIPELILYNRVLSAGEAAQVGAYLTAKYGLTTGYPGPAEFVTFGIPNSTVVIDNAGKTVQLTVPFSTSLATLAPTTELSTTTSTSVPASGVAPTPSFAGANPATYKVIDGTITNTYTVTITLAPALTDNVMSNVYFPGVGYAWKSDDTGTNFLISVPSTTAVTALAPTYNVSLFATGSPVSGTVRSFTTPQTYIVTAEDGTTQQAYSVTVQKSTTVATGYQGAVLASAPVSYWPLNETSGTTAFDIASGINPMTYGGTYTLNQPGLRPDGNPCVLFTTAAADPDNTRAAFNPSLNPEQFTVECWLKPTNTAGQYVVSLQDRSASVPSGGRWGYAIMKNNGGTGFSVMCGQPGTAFTTIQGTNVIVPGRVYHVVGTFDGSALRLYVNGQLDNSPVPIATYMKATSTDPGFTVGSRNGVTPAPSYIQDVAVYTRALTLGEIQTHYNTVVAYNWKGAGGANWSVADNWNNRVPGASNTAVLSDSASAGATVNLDADVTVGGLTFNNKVANQTIASTGGKTLTLASGSKVTVDAGSHSISANVNSGGTVTSSGPGALTLGGTTNYIGGSFFANGGSLTIPSSAALTVNGERFLANNGIAMVLSGILNVRDWGTVGAEEGFPGAPESTMVLKDSGQLNMLTSFFIVGDGGVNDGRLTIQDSAQLNASMLILGQYGQGAKGYVIQNSGTVNLTLANPSSLWYVIPALQIGSSASINWGGTWGNGQGEYHLNGGTLTAHSIGGGGGANGGSSKFYFNGGILKPTVSDAAVATALAGMASQGGPVQTNFMQYLTQVVVEQNGAIIDTAGQSISIDQSLLPGTGNGGLTKQGLGTLTLLRASTYTGTNVVLGGTLACATADALAPTALSIAATAKVDLQYSGTRTIPSLTLGGDVKGPGVYGLGTDPTYFTGTGTVTVQSPPPPTPTLPPSSFSIGTGGVPTFTDVPTTAGYTYWLTYKDSLTDAIWIRIGAGWVSDGSAHTFTDNVTPHPAQRFYRLEVQ